MSFSIVAEFPLGTYRGAGSDGRPERLPAVTRLHSALLSAAGFGPRSSASDDGSGTGYEPSPADADALRWVEDNPPDEVTIPAMQINAGRAVAYRDDGTLKKTKSSMTTKKLGKVADASTALGGAFVWTWTDDPPELVATALDALCPDVPYLGTTESPVRLRVVRHGAPSSTHELEVAPDPFAPVVGGEPTFVPRPGRLEALSDAHAVAVGRSPSPAKDGYRSDEKSTSMLPVRDAVSSALYVPKREELPTDLPWSQVFVLPLKLPGGGGLPEDQRVKAAVAAHRGLVAVLGYGAPSLVTGAYPEGATKPVNRLALQFVDASMPLSTPLPERADTALAVLVPPGCTPEEYVALGRAIGGLDGFGLRNGRTARVVGKPVLHSAARFWSEPEAGTLRLWETRPPAVPDTRGGRGTTWTFTHAALLSAGFVWKQQLGRQPGRGEQYYRALVEAAGASGVVALGAVPVRRNDVTNFVHKVNASAVVRPYRAVLSMGDLGTATCVQAIGQSRHLGGGLLVPVDVPVGTPLANVAWAGRAGGTAR